ncbi:MAG: hypothetical protein JSS52_02645 [Proteobacteria bacterium]|nr:hypothetical protein [Pseudomonadota bacterium]
MANRLTEKGAVFSFAKAWNRLDPEEFLRLLEADAHYSSLSGVKTGFLCDQGRGRWRGPSGVWRAAFGCRRNQ